MCTYLQRLHGSYDAVYGGQPGDAYLQLTGGIGERLELGKVSDKGDGFFKRVKNAIQSGCHVTCIVPVSFILLCLLTYYLR